MSALAQQLGPGLLVAALAAPLVVLAVFLSPAAERRLARAMTPLAPLPALAAALLAIGGAPFGAELPRCA